MGEVVEMRWVGPDRKVNVYLGADGRVRLRAWLGW
jgi:hypothetical protein